MTQDRGFQIGLLLGAVLLLSVQLQAEVFYPAEGTADRPNLIAGPAKVGGQLTEFLGPSPKSLNAYLDNNVMSAQVFNLMYESLLSNDPLTLENIPNLAIRWSVSDDSLVFTFWLDPRARWSDGVPVTADDVIWTYQAIMDPKNMTGPYKLSLERLEVPESLEDGRAVRFRAREPHWENLNAASGFYILPKHIYENEDFNRINFEFPVVSGPYEPGEMKPGIYLSMKRRNDWWQIDIPRNRGTGNFETIIYRFFEDRDNAFESFKRGEIDVMEIYSAYQWHEVENSLKSVWNNWIVRQRVHNQAPVGFQGFAMNMRRTPFDDVRVREAMACLLDRENLNRTMMYSQYFLHRSYWEDLYDSEHPCPNPQVEFSPERARKLLAEAGWTPNPATGLLEKNGMPLRFTFTSRDSSTDKFLVGFNEALKDVGIEMTVVSKDWSAWAKDMDEFNFDMTWCAWGAGIFKDPEGMWLSDEADRPGSSNITGFKNAEVDRLIKEQRTIFDVQARHEIVRQIDRIICAEYPYVLLWNSDSTRYLYWNKFGMPPSVSGKYSSGTMYWWYDDDKARELQEAIRFREPLPAESPEVWFVDP